MFRVDQSSSEGEYHYDYNNYCDYDKYWKESDWWQGDAQWEIMLEAKRWEENLLKCQK